MIKTIVANAIQGNVPNIPFIRIENRNGKVIFNGKEDGVWTNQSLLNEECIITSGYDFLICRLINR